MQKIGNIKLNKGAMLAPMADFTNIAFRTLAREYGSVLTYTELISVKSIIYKNSKTKKMLCVSEKEKPVFLQLFGNNPLDFKKAIKIIEEKYADNFAGYDLNCGCSVVKALKGKYGVSLMDDSKLVGEIITQMKQATKKPVTIKMRIGNKKENFLEVAKVAEKAGASAICLHARTAKQLYSGNADWSKIKELKKVVKIPVIANGDVKSVQDYIKIKKETIADYVMIGRGAVGNAFLFKQIKEIESGIKLEDVTKRTKKEIYLEGKKFLELIKEFNLGINNARGYFLGIASGFSGAKEVRNSFALSKSIKELENNFEKYFN